MQSPDPACPYLPPLLLGARLLLLLLLLLDLFPLRRLGLLGVAGIQRRALCRELELQLSACRDGAALARDTAERRQIKGSSPPTSLPLMSATARSASSGMANCTKPKPLCFSWPLGRTRKHLRTGPMSLNTASRSFSPTSKLTPLQQHVVKTIRAPNG